MKTCLFIIGWLLINYSTSKDVIGRVWSRKSVSFLAKLPLGGYSASAVQYKKKMNISRVNEISKRIVNHFQAYKGLFL